LAIDMSNEGDVQEYMFGAHATSFEPPDLYVVRFDGEYAEKELNGHSELFNKGPQPFYLILDASKLGSVSGGAKKALKNMPTAAAVALFGARAQVRLLLSFLTKVYLMVSQGKVEIQFFPDEPEARRWINQVRLSAKA
jgi:hypothetical protein